MPNEYPETSIHGEGDRFFARDLTGRFAVMRPAGQGILDRDRQKR